jgi:hypothetical protein
MKLSSQPMAAVIFFAGALAVCVIYGLRWFSKSGLLSQAPVNWPPFINTCPDYLTFYQRTVNGAKVDTCVDMIGVSKNGGLKPFPKDGVEPTQNEFYFDISSKESDPLKRYNDMCQRAMAVGLTWEGVTNGESCILPDRADGSGSGSTPSGGCPTY